MRKYLQAEVKKSKRKAIMNTNTDFINTDTTLLKGKVQKFYIKRVKFSLYTVGSQQIISKMERKKKTQPNKHVILKRKSRCHRNS